MTALLSVKKLKVKFHSEASEIIAEMELILKLIREKYWL